MGPAGTATVAWGPPAGSVHAAAAEPPRQATLAESRHAETGRAPRPGARAQAAAVRSIASQAMPRAPAWDAWQEAAAGTARAVLDRAGQVVGSRRAAGREGMGFSGREQVARPGATRTPGMVQRARRGKVTRGHGTASVCPGAARALGRDRARPVTGRRPDTAQMAAGEDTRVRGTAQRAHEEGTAALDMAAAAQPGEATRDPAAAARGRVAGEETWASGRGAAEAEEARAWATAAWEALAASRQRRWRRAKAPVSAASLSTTGAHAASQRPRRRLRDPCVQAMPADTPGAVR